jgi:hypothetical protein
MNKLWITFTNMIQNKSNESAGQCEKTEMKNLLSTDGGGSKGP